MPGVTSDIADLGLPAALLFGLPESKDEQGSGACDPKSVVQEATRPIKRGGRHHHHLSRQGCRVVAEGVKLDALDARLLDALQTEFSIEPAPFAALAQRLGAPEGEVIRRVEALREAGVIRKIGPVFDPGRMGFVTLLVAMKVAEDRIEAVGRALSEFPEVTHNYQRDHAYNLWYTIVAPSQQAADRVFEEAAGLPGVEAAHRLPALRRFKVSVRFAVEETRNDVAAP